MSGPSPPIMQVTLTVWMISSARDCKESLRRRSLHSRPARFAMIYRCAKEARVSKHKQRHTPATATFQIKYRELAIENALLDLITMSKMITTVITPVKNVDRNFASLSSQCSAVSIRRHTNPGPMLPNVPSICRRSSGSRDSSSETKARKKFL